MAEQSKEAAILKAKALLAKLPKRKGWKIDVWEKDDWGWYYEVRNDYVFVRETFVRGRPRYQAMVSGLGLNIGQRFRYYREPVTAIREVLNLVIEHRDLTVFMCNNILEAIEESICP